MNATAKINTVTGPISPDALGITLTHEHVLIDMRCYWRPLPDPELQGMAERTIGIDCLGALRRNPMAVRDNLVLEDLDIAIEELKRFAVRGGGTIVDVTPPDVGRDPAALVRASQASDLNIVMGSGHYVHHAHPPSLEDETIDTIRNRLISEIEVGVDGTDVRVGIIGEVGTSAPIHAREAKVLRASAQAQTATGIPISVHLHPSARLGNEILDILVDEGVAANRVVLCHLDIVLGHVDIRFDAKIDYLASLAERGSYLEFDCCGVELYQPGLGDARPCWLPSDRERALGIVTLMEMGYGSQILLSQDVCKKMDLVRYGGFGYAHVLRNFRESLTDYGLSEAAWRALVIENPREMLTPR